MAKIGWDATKETIYSNMAHQRQLINKPTRSRYTTTDVSQKSGHSITETILVHKVSGSLNVIN